MAEGTQSPSRETPLNVYICWVNIIDCSVKQMIKVLLGWRARASADYLKQQVLRQMVICLGLHRCQHQSAGDCLWLGVAERSLPGHAVSW